MIRAYFNSQKNLGIRRRIQARLIVLSAILLSRSLVLRKLLIVLISFFLKNKNHNNLYKKYSPNLIITGSLGLDVDGKVINEAKRMNVKTLTINQSWDRIV